MTYHGEVNNSLHNIFYKQLYIKLPIKQQKSIKNILKTNYPTDNEYK